MKIFFDKLSQKEKIGLMIAFSCLAVAFLDRLIVNPIRNKIKQINREVEISEKQLSMNLRNIKQKDVIEQEYEKYVDYVRRSGSDEEEVAKILGEIEVLARKSSVYLVDTKPQTPKKVDFYQQYMVEIEGEGEMKSIMRFLHELNISPQLLRAEKVRLSIKEKKAGVIKVSMLITKVLIF